jgi:CheY-like chemotaxis protein
VKHPVSRSKDGWERSSIDVAGNGFRGPRGRTCAVATVLAVDDDQVIRGLLQVNLEMEGHDVVTAVDGRDALAKVAEHHPDLILLDIMMPHVSGWDVLEQLKADPATADIPVVFLSARAMEADIRKGQALGVDRYVTKPFDPIDLMDLVSELLATRGAR